MNPFRKLTNLTRALIQRFAPAPIKRALWDHDYSPRGRYAHCYADTTWPALYSLIQHHCAGGALLDLGCGPGQTPAELPPGTFSQYLGVDISPVALAHARALNPSPSVAFHCADFTTFRTDRTFQLILLRESIYFFSDPVAAVHSLFPRLRPGGCIIVVVSESGSRRHYQQIQRQLITAFRTLPGLEGRPGLGGVGPDQFTIVIPNTVRAPATHLKPRACACA